MIVGVIGSGGREHAICHALNKSKKIHKIYCFPGNAGTTELAENINLDLNNFENIKDFILNKKIELVVIGPEKPLVDGLADYLENFDIKVFGPNKLAAQLEGSKIFTKNICKKYNIPTANFGVFNNIIEAKKFLDNSNFPIVIKADNLAAGKGVYICENKQESIQAVKEIFEGKFGEAKNVLIEEFLKGEEMSFFIISDGITFKNFGTAQDHKRVLEGDKGKNTGGMGAYSPAPVVTNQVHKKIMHEVIQPTIQGLSKEGINYCGFLYAGLMIDSQQNIKVLEFNCRFGDPETQPILMRLESDLIELCYQASKRELQQIELQWNPKVSLGVVMAAGGYPYQYEKGYTIEGLPLETENLKVFHAGTKVKDNLIETNGGRVLCVTALGKNTTEAQLNAYNCVEQIKWKDCFYRTDIGYRAIKRES